MNSLTRIGSVAGLAMSLSACGTLYKLDVVAHNNPNHDLGSNYVILSSDPKLDVNSPDFAKYASQLERALAAKNYHRVAEENIDDADLAIYFFAGISDPAKRYHEVNSAVTETAYDTTSTREAQTVGGGQGGGGSQGQGNQTRSIEPPPPDVLIGYEKRQFATTVYLKHLNIQAVDLHSYARDIKQLGRDKAVPKEIWSVEVDTTGSPSDLDEVVPIMIAAAQPYFGVSTDDNVRVKMSESDSRISSIKGK
jgi:hypothetical protein